MPSQRFTPRTNENYLMVEDQDSYEVTLGYRFSAFTLETVSATSGTSIIVLTSNSVKTCFAWFSIEVDKAGLYELYENPVCSGGSAITAINNNRNSSITADLTLVHNPTIATVGTFMGAHIIGSTTGGASKSGGSSTVNKYELKLNTSYMLRFTADADNTRATQGIYWREVNS